MDFKRISVDEAKQIMTQAGTAVIDIRDDASFAAGHIENALHLNDATVADFIQGADMDKPLVIYCYHGNSSQSAAQYFVEQGFSEVYSMDGGFAAWHHSS